VSGVLQARTRATETEAWAPPIIILGQAPDEDLRNELADLVAHMPRLGIATVSNGTEILPDATVQTTSKDTAEYLSGGATSRPRPVRADIRPAPLPVMSTNRPIMWGSTE
jgi:hypothetical protein